MDIKWTYDSKSVHSWATYSLYLKDKLVLSILEFSGEETNVMKNDKGKKGRPDVSKFGVKVSSKTFPEIGRDSCLLNQEGI